MAPPQPHPVGLRFVGDASAPADVVQVAQRHGRVALLVVGLGDIEVKLRHAVDREFEPFARTGFVPKFDVLGTAVLPLVFELPVLVQIPTAVAGIVLGVDAVEIERRLRTGSNSSALSRYSPAGRQSSTPPTSDPYHRPCGTGRADRSRCRGTAPGRGRCGSA